MYYRESARLNRRYCKGYRDNPSSMMFSSHEIGIIKGYFSQYERYNDSDVSVSVDVGYSIDITVNSNLDKGSSWCSGKINDALEYVKGLVIDGCKSSDDNITITIELNTRY